MNRLQRKPTTIRRLLLVAAIGAAGTVGAAATMSTPAQGMACLDHACDLPPVPPKVGKPTVEFGCGTVTVSSGDVSETLPILPCPGPVIV